MKTVIEFAQVMGYDIDKQDPMLAEFIDAMVRVEKRAYELMERRSQGELADLAEGESGRTHLQPGLPIHLDCAAPLVRRRASQP